MRVDRGFGLLEALVALTLLASTGVAIFGWINQNLATAQRLREHEIEQRWRQIAAAWLRSVDLDTQAEGEAEPVAGLRLRWRSQALGPFQTVPPLPGGQSSGWQLRLLRVDAELSGEGLPRLAPLSLTRLQLRRQAESAQ